MQRLLSGGRGGGSQSDKKPATPATSDLFDKSEQAEQLSSGKSEVFHSIVQKILYICKRGRPDIEPALSYLCTRVSKPMVEDEKKLHRMLDFLKDTLEDVQNHWVLIISINCTCGLMPPTQLIQI